MTNKKKKILLIDDDPSVSAAILMLLKDEFEAHAAGTVREGVRLFDSLNPSVVILDLHLPDEHGLEALRSIRKLDRTAPVIILTGYATLDAVEESMRLGASDCLHKPFNAVALQSRLRELAEEPEALEDVGELKVEEQNATYFAPVEASNDLVSSAFLHDISNPLTSLLAISAMLKESVDDAEMRARLCEMVDQNVEYLAALTDQWRAFSEPESLKPDFASIDVILGQVLTLARPRAEVKNVRLLEREASKDICPRLNRYAVTRILVNLLQNAIEAAPRDSGEVEVYAVAKGGAVEFVVTDNGGGIPPEERQKIFLPRYSTKRKGRGLGLYIARKIVESANGSISICSRPGRGTSFTVQLPAC